MATKGSSNGSSNIKIRGFHKSNREVSLFWYEASFNQYYPDYADYDLPYQ